MPAVVTLKPGRVQPVWAGHPWVYAQAIDSVSAKLEAGAEVDVRDPKGQFLGRGLWSPNSAIAVRLFTRSERAIDSSLFRDRLERALSLRTELGLPNNDTTGYRWIHGEGDGLPGLIVDVFGRCVSLQFGSFGLWQRREVIIRHIDALLNPDAIFDRTTARVAKLEGFEVEHLMLKGSERALEFAELGVRYRIPFELQQKTGYYCDQRSLRSYVREVAPGKRVLDAYSYVGSVGLVAARAGAKHVVSVDKSEPAIECARELSRLNEVTDTHEAVSRDTFEFLADAPNQSFDVVVCDPPKLAQNKKGRENASKLLRSLAREACRVTSQGGQVILSSCSAAIGTVELSRALAMGSLEVGRQARITERLFQSPDHPVLAGFQEGEYLSTIVAHVTRRD